MFGINPKHKNAFSSAVAKIVPDIDPNLKIDANAKKYLALNLYNMAREIAANASEAAAEGGKTLLEGTDIHGVLPNFFLSDALRCAQQNGSRYAHEYSLGLIEFVPKRPQARSFLRTAAAQKMVVDQFTPELFRKGLRDLMKEIQGAPTRTDEGCKHILEIVAAIGDTLTSCVANDARSGRIEELDVPQVQRSIANVLPERLFYLGAAFGNDQAANYMRGVLQYKRPVPKTKKAISSLKGSAKLKGKSAAKSPRKRKADGKAKTPPRKKMKTATKRAPTKKAPSKAEENPKEKADDDLKKFIADIAKRLPVELNREVTNRINEHVSGICDLLLADLAASVKKKSEVSEKDVLATVKKIFPSEINKHAVANVNQSLYRQKVYVVFKDTNNGSSDQSSSSIDEEAGVPDESYSTADEKGDDVETRPSLSEEEAGDSELDVTD